MPGHSSAPIRATDSWAVYTEDQLALLDHLGVERFHVGACVLGGPTAWDSSLIERWKEPEHQDEGETCMKAGDVLIQCGTNHAWSNRSSAPALVAFVLVGANAK